VGEANIRAMLIEIRRGVSTERTAREGEPQDALSYLLCSRAVLAAGTGTVPASARARHWSIASTVKRQSLPTLKAGNWFFLSIR